MKKIWVGTSWKMNKTQESADAWANEVSDFLVTQPPDGQVFVIPPFPYIRSVSDRLAKTSMLIGAQNMCWEASGAYTGEVSPLMVKDNGAQLVEIGHSERRAFFGETDDTVNKKVLSALAHDLIPLVCIGDSLQEKKWGVSAETVIRQIKIALHAVPTESLLKVVLAYEPIWAIGESGIPATAEEAEFIHCEIRKALRVCYGNDIAHSIYILYGGSVNHSNVRTLINQPNIDGVFVGRSAWQPQDFCQLLNLAFK